MTSGMTFCLAYKDPAGLDEDAVAKLLNSFSLGENADDAEIDEIMPFMTNMMQKLLSKELLQPVLADIVDRVSPFLVISSVI